MHRRKSIVKKATFAGIVVAIIVVADLLIGAVSKNAILNVRDVGVNQTNTVQAFFKRKADVLILGPSTANHHFDTRIIKDSLKMTCYNAGRDGQNVVYNAMVLDAFLTRCTPKLVIMDVGSSTLSDKWMVALSDFNCYYGILKPVDEILDSIATPIERVKRLSNIYRYNKTWEWLLNGKIDNEVADLDGYRPMPVNADANFKAVRASEHFIINETCKHYLDRIVQVCKEKNIRLVITSSPSMVIDEGNFLPDMNAYCREKGVEFFDWNGDAIYTNHSELFYDMTHLNADGAKIFTKDLLRQTKMKEYALSQ